MSGLAVVALGVGDAFSARYYSAGVALDVGDFAAVVVTHLPADHSSGLEGFGYFAHFVLGRRARLLAHPEVLAEVWDGHLAAGMRRLLEPERLTARDLTLGDYFDATPLAETGAVEVGPFKIECR